MENNFLNEARILFGTEVNNVKKALHIKKRGMNGILEAIPFMSEPYAFLGLHIANIKGDEIMRDECLKKIMNSQAVLDGISFRINNYYNYYGCEQLDFIYQNIERDEFIITVWMTVREHLKKFDGSTIPFPRTSEGYLDLSQKSFEVNIQKRIFKVAKWAYVELLKEKGREFGMSQLSTNHLSDYAMIRKVCNYEVDIIRNTNEEIIACYESHWEDNKLAETKADARSMGCKDIDDKVLNRIRNGFTFVSIERDTPVHDLEEKEALKELFLILSKDERTVIQLRYLNSEKMTFGRIGEILNCSTDHARYLEKKALAKLKNEYEN